MGIEIETVRDICTLALKESGVLGVGQTALAEDINDTYTLLTRMLAQWQRKRWIVPSLYDIAAVGNGAKSNKIGPGQFWNAPRPDKVQTAYFIQISNGIVSSNSNAVSFNLIQIFSYEDYARLALKNLPAWPQYFFYDNQYPVGNVYIWPIPDATYEVHLILKSPIGFLIELLAGNITNAGALYTNGVYLNVPTQNLTGYGSGATLDITVAGGVVTVANINNSGNGYQINDQLTVNNTNIGGTGNGFIYTVTDVTENLNAQMTMPPEYYEAIHYNLARRIMEMYNYPVPPSKAALARASLNTIRLANAQIPTLNIPPSLRNVRGANFYLFNADAH